VLIADIEVEELLRDGLRELNLPHGGTEAESLARFLALLEKWNRAFNLTAVREQSEMVARHVLDSLSALPFIHGVSVLDVGTGAGLPGIPLAVMQPRRQFVLLDSGGKKIRFVRHAIGELSLANIEVVQSRVENYAPADPFDTVICRAFSSLRAFVDRCGALAARGGRLVAMKGRMENSDADRLPSPWQVTSTTRVAVPGLIGERHIVVIERESAATGEMNPVGSGH
jgi:16S rRNA (guanine527-N7)-methyltransferase